MILSWEISKTPMCRCCQCLEPVLFSHSWVLFSCSIYFLVKFAQLLIMTNIIEGWFVDSNFSFLFFLPQYNIGQILPTHLPEKYRMLMCHHNKPDKLLLNSCMCWELDNSYLFACQSLSIVLQNLQLPPTIKGQSLNPLYQMLHSKCVYFLTDLQ